MAIITIAAPLSGIRGKVGGVIYSANKSGPYLKGWARGSNPRTFLQTEHRSVFTSLSTTWRTLSAADKLTWDDYAALPAQELTNSLGEDYSIPGFNWYIRININRNNFTDGFTDVAPTTGTPAMPDLNEVLAFSTADAGSTRISLNVGTPGDGERMAIKAEMVTSQGNVAGPEIKTFMIIRKRALGQLNFAFKDELLEHFGTAQIGQKVFASIQQQSADGRRSAPATGSADITV